MNQLAQYVLYFSQRKILQGADHSMNSYSSHETGRFQINTGPQKKAHNPQKKRRKIRRREEKSEEAQNNLFYRNPSLSSSAI